MNEIAVPTKDRAIGRQVYGNGAAQPQRPAEAPATEKQEAFLRRLLDEKEHGWDPSIIDQLVLSKKAASAAIDHLLGCPRKAQSSTTQGDPVTEDGMYRKDGEIFKVQRAVHGSGNLYAKRLIERATPKVMKTKTVTHEFEYAPGMIRKLSALDKMSLEEAKAWGALYGSCCVCGATLTKESSIEAGIGPVCATKGFF